MNTENAIEKFTSIAAHSENIDQLMGLIELLPKAPTHGEFRNYLIYHNDDLFYLLKKQITRNRRFYEININDEAKSIEFGLVKEKNQDQFISGTIAVLPGISEHVSRIFTVSFSQFWIYGIKKLVQSLYPQAIPLFFTQEEIYKSLKMLETAIGQNKRIRITEATLKEKRKNNNVAKRKLHDTFREWINKPVDDCFQEATEKNQWFSSISFDIEQTKSESQFYRKFAAGKVNKKGYFSYTYHQSLFSNNLIAPLEKFSINRISQLSGRGLIERNFLPASPLEIKYPLDLFSDIEEIRKFGRTISKYPYSTQAVLHGNPYYHSYISDFRDGSSFEVWILSPSRILLIPQVKATAQAFQRLVSFIFYEFKEGVINEYCSNGE